MNGKNTKTAPPVYEGLLHIGRSSFYAGVKSKKFPEPIRISSRTVVWSKRELLEKINPVEAAKLVNDSYLRLEQIIGTARVRRTKQNSTTAQ